MKKKKPTALQRALKIEGNTKRYRVAGLPPVAEPGRSTTARAVLMRL